VMFEAVQWGERDARINTISPGIIMTPLAKDELTGPRGPGYRRMIEGCPAKRAGTPDEVGNVAALLMGPDGAFITGSDFLMDGAVTAAHWFGELPEVRNERRFAVPPTRRCPPASRSGGVPVTPLRRSTPPRAPGVLAIDFLSGGSTATGTVCYPVSGVA
jgi:Enoyl-(Acyl carrier protein) reductase